jgi:osmoprotectant transport system permease protein
VKPYLVPLVGLLALLLPGCQRPTTQGGKPIVRAGSKSFIESALLGEVLRELAESAGAHAEHVARLGDTSKVWNALLAGEVDAYCEYTGTLRQEILAREKVRSQEDLGRALEARGLRMSRSLGFSNNYAVGMREDRASALGIRTISDLRNHPELKLGLSHPFLERGDGWRGLQKRYDLPFRTPEGLEHSLVYVGLQQGTLDVVDLYTTDAAIPHYGLRVLEDDRQYFPRYDAVVLYRADLAERAPEVVKAFLRLEGAISAETMQSMNARVEIDHNPDAQVASDYLAEKLGLHVDVVLETRTQRLERATWQHIRLVAISLALGIVCAVPLGVLAARRPVLGQLILGAVGIIQTIPALALLTLLIVLLGQMRELVEKMGLSSIGVFPAIIALFLYSLLPILRNTHAGLHDIPLQIRESAEALGLSSFARLYLVELPMASRSILAGIKTAAVINVGFATLGGLIGAGGYGQAIITGLDKTDYKLMLEGAIPAMVLALLVQGIFEIAEQFLVPKGLRLEVAR